jgi:hypothetical protein
MANLIDPIDNHQDAAKDRLPYQFEDRPNIEAVIDVFAEKIQEYEDLLLDFLNKRDIDNAVGIQLDFLGEVFLVDRNNDGDEIYRGRIKTAIYEFTKAGQIDVLIDTLQNLIGNVPVFLDEYIPATVIMSATVSSLPVPNADVINDAMQRAKAYGIKLDVGAGLERSFKFASMPNQYNTGFGFADITAPENFEGQFATILR